MLVAWVLLACFATLAMAHSADPSVVTSLDSISPALPTRVVIQVQASLAEELVADNPTEKILEVLASSGEPFLRLSAAGVFANLASPSWYGSNSPFGIIAPAIAARLRTPPAAPRWERVSRGTSWGWFDHRLHPTTVTIPPELRAARRSGLIAHWQVPFRYGTTTVSVSGSLTYRPVIGGFLTRVAPVPSVIGLTVDVLQGRLPGLAATYTGAATATVLDGGGGDYLRFDHQRVQAWSGSPAFVMDQQAKGQQPPAGVPRWITVSPRPTYSWLDRRIGYPQDVPSDAVLASTSPVVVAHWQIPVLVASGRYDLTGDVTWVPDRSGLRFAPGSVSKGSGLSTGRVGVYLLGALALVGGLAFTLRTRRRRGKVSL